MRRSLSCRRYLCAVLAIALTLLCAACGFALRGQAGLPLAMERTHMITPGAYSELGLDLAEALRRSGVRVLARAEADAAVLEIHEERVRRRTVAVAADGLALEYELEMRVVFSLHREQTVLLPRQTLTLTRELTASAQQQVLGGESEAERLVDDMRADAVEQVLLRLRRAGTP